jgi:hypothetical protein
MAQKVVQSIVDDLDDSLDADETVKFGLDGAEFEIDLTSKHAEGLRGALAVYVAKARRLSGRRNPRGTTTRSNATTYTAPTQSGAKRSGSTGIDREQNAAIREWARKQGAVVSERGRIPQPIHDAYNAGRPEDIPDRYRTAKAEPVSLAAPEPDHVTATLEVTTEPVSLDVLATAEETEQEPTIDMRPELMPDTPSQMSKEQKKVIAEWAVEQGIIDRPSVSKVSRDLIGNFKAHKARALADA